MHVPVRDVRDSWMVVEFNSDVLSSAAALVQDATQSTNRKPETVTTVRIGMRPRMMGAFIAAHNDMETARGRSEGA